MIEIKDCFLKYCYIPHQFNLTAAVRTDRFDMAFTWLLKLKLSLLQKQNYDADTHEWPQWLLRLTNVSHLLLTVASSTNFIIYFAKHGRLQLSCRQCCQENDNYGQYSAYEMYSFKVKYFTFSSYFFKFNTTSNCSAINENWYVALCKTG